MDQMIDFLKELHGVFEKYNASITSQTVYEFEDEYNVLEICVSDSSSDIYSKCTSKCIHTGDCEMDADTIQYLINKNE